MSDPGGIPRAGFGVGVKFTGQIFSNSRLKQLSAEAGTIGKYDEIKDSLAMKGTTITIYSVENGQATELDTKSEGRWMVVTDDIGVGSLANLSSKYIVDGVNVKVEPRFNSEGQSVARTIGTQIRDFYVGWIDWKSITAAKPQDRDDLLSSKIYMAPAFNHPANADKKAVIEKYITPEDRWLLTATPIVKKSLPYQPTIDFTTALPIALLLDLPDSLRYQDIRLNPFTASTEPLDDQRDADQVYVCTDEKLRTLGVLKDPNGSLPPDFRGFITLCTIFAVRAPVAGLLKGPKQASGIIPRNDFKSLLDHVSGSTVLQSCQFPQTGVDHTALGYSVLAYIVAALAIRIKKPSAVLDTATLMAFKADHFIWGVGEVKKLNVLEWLAGLTGPKPQDLLTLKDKEYGDGSIGRLRDRWELAAGKGAPIFEFREMKGYLTHENQSLDLPGKLESLNEAFYNIQNPEAAVAH